eukprot:20936-Heterococcus_DN1.PRE.1
MPATMHRYLQHTTARYNPEAKIQQYDVSVKGKNKMDMRSKKLTGIVAAFKQQHPGVFEGCGVAFDGRSIICEFFACRPHYCSNRLVHACLHVCQVVVICESCAAHRSAACLWKATNAAPALKDIDHNPKYRPNELSSSAGSPMLLTFSHIHALQLPDFCCAVLQEFTFVEAALGTKPAETHTLVMQWTAERCLSDIDQYLDARRSQSASDVINALDVVSCYAFHTLHCNRAMYCTGNGACCVLRTVGAQQKVSAGRSFFTAAQSWSISGGAKVMLGYYQSLRATQ